MRINWRDASIRAIKTFVQAFISAFAFDSLLGITNMETLKRALVAVLISAGAAGISAVWNLLVGWINAKLDEAFKDSEDEGAE